MSWNCFFRSLVCAGELFVVFAWATYRTSNWFESFKGGTLSMNCLPLFCFAYSGVASVAFAFSAPPFSTSASWKLLASTFIKVDALRPDGLGLSSRCCLPDPRPFISSTSKSFDIMSDDSPWRKDSLLTTDTDPSSALFINYKKSFWSFWFLLADLNYYNFYLLDLYCYY